MDSCSECGAERPSWMGASHRARDNTLVCIESGLTCDEYFHTWLEGQRRMNRWPVHE